MVSDFDKIFTKAQAQHEAKNHAAEQGRKRREREAEEEAQTVESIALSYMRDLGIQASRRLLDLGIPLYRRSWKEEVRSLFGGRKYKTVHSDELWTFHGLHLTKEGYFLNGDDYRLPGPIGFAKLVKGIRLLAPNEFGGWPGGLGHGEIYVDARTKRLCISIHHSLGAEMGYDSKTYDLGEWVADEVLFLMNWVARGEKVNYFA